MSDRSVRFTTCTRCWSATKSAFLQSWSSFATQKNWNYRSCQLSPRRRRSARALVRHPDGLVQWGACGFVACPVRISALHYLVFLSHLECSSFGLHDECSRLQNLGTVCHKQLFIIGELMMTGGDRARGY